MKKSLLISEQDSIAAILENERVVEFFVNRGELLLGDIYSATVENILPGIDAAFVNLGKDKMGFLHANDVPGQGPLKERLVPKQKLLVQITKEPTGHKGPRVSTAISLPGRFLVLVPEERGVSISRRISEARERARLKSVVNLMKPPGVGLIIRTEAKGQGEQELFEDFEQLWDRWQTVVSEGEASIGPTLIYRDQDLLFRVIRDAYSNDVNEIIVDSPDGQRRAQEYLQGWAGRTTRVSHHLGEDSLLVSRGVDKEIEAALSDRVELPSGGHLNIQPTEALTVIDVNSGRFTSSRTQAETVRRTNLEAAQEIPRQLRLRNIGGMVIVDFIDMDSRKDQQQVLEVFQRVLEEDRAKPQVGQLSDLGLVELTRRRQGQSLRELFTVHCTICSGMGVIPTLELGAGEHRRVISFKSRDEEAKARNSRRPMRQQSGQVLRAATAHNGRVMPTVEEEHEHEEFDVPEDILEQMPDDLLADPANKELKGGIKRAPFGQTDSDLDDEDEENEGESNFAAANTQNFAPKKTVFETGFTEEDESSLSNDLHEHISAVAEVFQDMGSRARTEAPAEHGFEGHQEVSGHGEQEHQHHEQEQEHHHHEHEHQHHEHHGHDQHNHEHEHGHEQHEQNHEHHDHGHVAEEQPAVEEENEDSFTSTASPFETEYDPITGVYRLKAKSDASSTGNETAADISEQYNQAEESRSEESIDTRSEEQQLNLFSNGYENADQAQENNQHEEEHEHHESNADESQQEEQNVFSGSGYHGDEG